MDYSNGSYIVTDATGRAIGRIDSDEFVRAISGPTLLFRLDGEEVYKVDGPLVGTLSGSVAHDTSGNILFKIRPE